MARLDLGMDGLASMAQAKPTPENLFELGIAYSSGGEVEPDLVAAHKWFNLAAARGVAEAANYRQEIAREMSPMAIAEAQRAAREWLSTH
jgi:TPR repeat protein